MMGKNLLEKIPDIILAQLASFSLVYGLTSSLCLTYTPLKILLLVMMCIMVLFTFFHNKKTSLAAFIFLGTASAACIIFISFGTGIHKVITFFDEYFYWLGDFIQYPDTPDPVYQFITVIVLCIFISIFSYIFIVKRFLFLVILGAGMGLFTIQWSYNIVSSLIPFYIFLLISLIAWLKYVYVLRTSKEPNNFSKSAIIIIWSLPVCIIIIALAYSFHASDKPIEWKWLDKKVISVYNYINRNFDYEAFDYFSLSDSSGFGGRDHLLGGRVRLDRTNVLKVTTDKNIYLKGAAKEVYTGTAWLNSSHEETPMGNNYSLLYDETSEMLLGMKILTGNDNFIEDYFYTNKASITFMNLKTKSLFIPSKTTAFSPKNNSFTGFINNTGDLSAKKRLTKGFNYTLEMYIPKIGTEELINILRESKRGLYSKYLTENYKIPDIASSVPSSAQSTARQPDTIYPTTPVIQIYPQKNNLVQPYDDVSRLILRSEQIYDSYLQLPRDLPQRVKDLSASLVSYSTNDYDKAKAIEQYLSSNYAYNLDVRSTPRNRDFVDYFLFDLKQGYCSYYASAMTVMARCVGLPARYIEGYMLPPEPVKDNSTTYIVTNMQAHAWVEIYFEGYGWLPFEPTAPFQSNFYVKESSGTIYTGDYNSSYDDYMEMMKMYSNQDDLNVVNNGDEIQDNASSPVLIVLIITGFVILFIAVLFLFNIIRTRFRFYKLVNLPAKECILNLYNNYVFILGLQGLGYKTAETPFQYSDRIDSYMFFSPVRFKVITDIFVKSRYSMKDATEKEKQLLCDFNPGFMEEIKVNMGKFRYFIYKYILGRF